MTTSSRFAHGALILGAIALEACSPAPDTSAPFASRPTAPPSATISPTPAVPLNAPLAAPTHRAGGKVSGLAGKGLVLETSQGDVAVKGNGEFALAKPIAEGTAFSVSVKTHPFEPSQGCTVKGGERTMGAADITDIEVDCSTKKFAVGGTVIGLIGSGFTLQNEGMDDAVIGEGGSFHFASPVFSGTSFAVSIKTQPSAPSQTCSIAGGTGTVGAGPVSSIVVNCTTSAFTVGGTISGLQGTAVFQNNGGDDLEMSGNGSFSFHGAIASGQPYAVTVLTDPTSPPQTCTVTAGSGIVGDGPVDTVQIACLTKQYAISGTVSGMTGSGLVLRDNGGDDLGITGNGAFSFSTGVFAGYAYDVTVATQPNGQFCSVTKGSGIVDASAVTEVAVSCATFQNASFEDGFAGWSLSRTEDTTAGGATIIQSGVTINFTDILHDAISNTDITQIFESPATPATFTALSSEGGGRLGLLFVVNDSSVNKASQVITVPASATTLLWDSGYASGYDPDDDNQSFKVTLRDPDTDAVLATIWTAGTGAAMSEAVTTHNADVSAYAGMRVRIQLEVTAFWAPGFLAFDAFRVQ